jgi:hypothetical protein
MIATTNPSSTGYSGDGVRHFSPDDYLINIVKRAVANGQNVEICADENGCVLVMTKRGEFFADVRSLEDLCRTPATKFRVTVQDGDTHPLARDIGRNIDELMWCAGFYASQGRLMEGCFRDDVVELSYWPNFTRLPSTANGMRLAALLSRYPTSIALASRLLKIDAGEAYQFYTAARCAGLARAVNRRPEEPPLKPHRNQALLGLLLNKIAGL